MVWYMVMVTVIRLWKRPISLSRNCNYRCIYSILSVKLCITMHWFQCTTVTQMQRYKSKSSFFVKL